MEENNQEKPNDTKKYRRDSRGYFIVGTAPGPGRTPETEEDKIRKKAMKKAIEDFAYELTLSLKKISPVLIQKALEGDINAIKEVNDRALGKPKNQVELSTDPERPMEFKNISESEIDKAIKIYEQNRTIKSD